MARLIKIYDADWANRKKRPAHLDETLWRVAPVVAGSRVSVLWAALWAAEARARSVRAATGTHQLPAAFYRAETG